MIHELGKSSKCIALLKLNINDKVSELLKRTPPTSNERPLLVQFLYYI